MKRASILRQPAVRNFLLLWLGQIAVGLGDVIYNVAVMVTIYEQTNSAVQTTGVMVATTLPPFLLGSFAGAIVDRYPRRLVLISMNVLRALAIVALIGLAQGPVLNVWGIYAVAALLAVAAVFYIPARQAIIPEIVPPQRLIRANSLIISTVPATFAVGFAVGGLLVLALPLALINGVILLCMVVGALLVTGIRLETRAEGVDSAESVAPLTIFQSIAEGFAYLRQHAVARALVTMETLEHVPHGIWTAALMLVFVEQALGGGSQEWGYQNAAFFAAMLLGAVLASFIQRWLVRIPGWLIIFNAFISGVLSIAYAYSPSNLFALFLAFGFGIPFAVRDVAQDSLLQATVARENLGRIYAFREMGRSIVFMLSSLGFAALAATVNIRTIYIIGGFLYFGTALFALFSRALRDSQIVTAQQKPVGD